MINIEKPVFFIGAPKCGSTSFHMLLENLGIFNLPLQKDTHYLWNKNFSVEKYATFFRYNNPKKRIAEVDQNLAIYPVAIKNIVNNFENPYLLYVVRDPKKRFISAYKWLKKMALVDNLEEGLKSYNKWLIDQGNYKKNIEEIIKPIAMKKATIIIIRFEDLIKNKKTLNIILNEIGIDTTSDIVLPRVNVSSAPRNKYLVKIAKYIYSYIKYANIGIIPTLKNSEFINKLLFTDNNIELDKNEMRILNSLEGFFEEQKLYIQNLPFKEGVICIT